MLALQIAVCDDDPTDCGQIEQLTRELMAAEGLTCTVTGYGSAKGLLQAMQSGARFHILLLDVMMDSLDGITLAAALRKQGEEAAIIFVSSNQEMAMRGYEVSAARYLAKPVQEPQMREALLYCYKTCCENREILLPTEKGQSKLLFSDIAYVESWGRGSRIQFTDGSIKTPMRISEMAAMLPERSFTFCHRIILVNLAFIKHLRSREIELAGGETLPVSKYRFPELKRRLLRYLD